MKWHRMHFIQQAGMPFPVRLSWAARTRALPSHVEHIVLTHKYVVALLAFLVSVDLIEIVGVLCYQLFTASYFPWHLYPMMLNRAAELIALICSRGHIPSLYSTTQVVLSLLSLVVYAKRQPCAKHSCAAPLVVYSVLLSYELFVAIMVVKVSRMPMADDDGHVIANGQPSLASHSQQRPIHPVGIQIIGLSPRAMRARIFREVELPSAPCAGPPNAINPKCELIFAVQQPDGEKLAIARPCKELSAAAFTPEAAASNSTPATTDLPCQVSKQDPETKLT